MAKPLPKPKPKPKPLPKPTPKPTPKPKPTPRPAPTRPSGPSKPTKPTKPRRPSGGGAPAPTPVAPVVPPTAGGWPDWMKIALAGAGIYNYDNIKNFLTGGGAKPAATTSPTSRALSPDTTVVPKDKDAVIPPPQGGGNPTTGGNSITPDQVKENLKNYPNSSGRPWSGLSASGQVLDAAGRKRTYTGSYVNEYDGAGNVVGQRDMGMDPDGPIAQKQDTYFNERGMRTAFQQDLDINTQAQDRNSPLFRAMDRMRGGQLTDFRLGNEESDASYNAMVAQRESDSAQRRGTGIPHPLSERGLARQAQYQAQNPVRGRAPITQESKDLYAGMIKGMSLEEKKRLFASGKLFPTE